MSLSHALLIALIENPGSGLELSDRFDRSIGMYWHAPHQQIYRNLAQLEAAGWVSSTPVESSRGRKKEYRVLAAGRKELRRWVREAREPEPYRSELMIRMRAEATLGPCGLDTEIERRLLVHQARLASYKDFEKRRFREPNSSRSTAIMHLILKKGMMNESTWIDWLRQALHVLRQNVRPT